MTIKQKAFVRELIDNPKNSATQAAMKVYGREDKPVNARTASVIASENLAKPEIIMALGEHSELFESAIVGTVRDWGKSENTRQREIALDAAKYGHDKVHGRAKQQLDVRTEVMSVSIDLTGTLDQPEPTT